MKILHDNGFTEDEIKHKKAIVYANTVRGMAAILSAVRQFGLTLDSIEHEVAVAKYFTALFIVPICSEN